MENGAAVGVLTFTTLALVSEPRIVILISMWSFPPIANWFAQVTGGQGQPHYMVFWHHFSGGGGNHTHTSNPGIFFTPRDAAIYASSLVARCVVESRRSFPEDYCHRLQAGTELNDLTCSWDSQDIVIVNATGLILSRKLGGWSVDVVAGTAELSFEASSEQDFLSDIKASQ